MIEAASRHTTDRGGGGTTVVVDGGRSSGANEETHPRSAFQGPRFIIPSFSLSLQLFLRMFSLRLGANWSGLVWRESEEVGLVWSERIGSHKLDLITRATPALHGSQSSARVTGTRDGVHADVNEALFACVLG